MSKVISVENGDVADGYKEYYINSLISMGIWKTKYPQLWVDAGGEELLLNGRTYFGGYMFLDTVDTPEKEDLLYNTGFDDAGIEEIRTIRAQEGVSHVNLRLKPRRTFTLDGLSWFFSNVVKKNLDDEMINEFVTYHKSEWGAPQEAPFVPTFPDKILASAEDGSYTLYGSDTLNSSADTNSALELLYRFTSWFEDNELISTTVSEDTSEVEEITVDGDGNTIISTVTIYQYTTTITISLANTLYLTSSVHMQELFDMIYFGNAVEDYYSSEFVLDENTELVEVKKYYAAYSMWDLEYVYEGVSDLWVSEFSDGGDDLVIYYNGFYWIDIEKWKVSHSTLCLITLARLFDIYVVEYSGGFWNTFLGGFLIFIINMIDAVVMVLGEIIYAILWVFGLWFLDVAAHNGIINRRALNDFKKISKKVLGTIALIILTWGISEYIQSMELAAAQATAETVGTVEAYAAVAALTASATEITLIDMILALVDVVTAGFDAYAQLGLDALENAEQAAEIEDSTDPIMVVYEDSDDQIYAAEVFMDFVYDAMDPYEEMERDV